MRLLRALNAIERAGDAAAALVEDVRVDHRGRDILVAEKLLDGADVIAALQQMRGETVPQDMRRHGFCDTSLPCDLRYGALHDLLVQVMAANDAVERIGLAAAGGEYVLPGPAATRTRVLAR